NYAALEGAAVEFHSENSRTLVRSWPSGAVFADVGPGSYSVVLSKPGFGSKRVTAEVRDGAPIHFRLLSDRLLGYAWPKWCRGGDRVEFRIHAVEPYKLLLWRYGYRKAFIRNVGWYDTHGPRACMQTVPDKHFVETGVNWHNGFGVHRQTILAPDRTGLYY